MAAMLGALVYAIAGVRVLRWSLPAVVAAFREYWPPGSGGLGAVSIGLSEMLVALVLPLVAIVANRSLARWARGSGGAAVVLHRAQTWVIVLAFAVVIAGVALAVRSESMLFLALPLDAVVWGALFVLTAALLGVYAARSS